MSSTTLQPTSNFTATIPCEIPEPLLAVLAECLNACPEWSEPDVIEIGIANFLTSRGFGQHPGVLASCDRIRQRTQELRKVLQQPSAAQVEVA